MAIENLTATTLRNIIGELELDQTLTSREIINTKMRVSLDQATDPWGIKVNRVELKNIIPPAEIQNAMERQMKAERERREAVTRAEGEKKPILRLRKVRNSRRYLKRRLRKRLQYSVQKLRKKLLSVKQKARQRLSGPYRWLMQKVSNISKKPEPMKLS